MRSPVRTARTSRATAASMSLRCDGSGRNLRKRRLEEVRHALELDLARRQQPRHGVRQAVALGDGQRRALVAEPRGPAPAGQRPLDAEEGRSCARGIQEDMPPP